MVRGVEKPNVVEKGGECLETVAVTRDILGTRNGPFSRAGRRVSTRSVASHRPSLDRTRRDEARRGRSRSPFDLTTRSALRSMVFSYPGALLNQGIYENMKLRDFCAWLSRFDRCRRRGAAWSRPAPSEVRRSAGANHQNPHHEHDETQLRCTFHNMKRSRLRGLNFFSLDMDSCVMVVSHVAWIPPLRRRARVSDDEIRE